MGVVSREGDTDRWVEEHWLVRSVRENWGLELVLSFLVNPHYEGQTKSREIWAIGATIEVPEDRLAAERGIALMQLAKGKFNEKLPKFVDELDRYRRSS
jgi:hypothetical protein